MIKLVMVREYEYIPKSEKDKSKEEQTIFKLKTLTSEDKLIIEDGSTDYDAESKQLKLLIGTSILKRVMVGLIGWNLKENNLDISFTKENIKKLPIDILKELSEELISSSVLTATEEKN